MKNSSKSRSTSSHFKLGRDLKEYYCSIHLIDQSIHSSILRWSFGFLDQCLWIFVLCSSIFVLRDDLARPTWTVRTPPFKWPSMLFVVACDAYKQKAVKLSYMTHLTQEQRIWTAKYSFDWSFIMLTHIYVSSIFRVASFFRMDC